jgi:hypothetical protein
MSGRISANPRSPTARRIFPAGTVFADLAQVLVRFRVEHIDYAVRASSRDISVCFSEKGTSTTFLFVPLK